MRHNTELGIHTILNRVADETMHAEFRALRRLHALRTRAARHLKGLEDYPEPQRTVLSIAKFDDHLDEAAIFAVRTGLQKAAPAYTEEELSVVIYSVLCEMDYERLRAAAFRRVAEVSNSKYHYWLDEERGELVLSRKPIRRFGVFTVSIRGRMTASSFENGKWSDDK